MRPRPPAYVRDARPVEMGGRGGCTRGIIGLVLMGFVIALGVPPIVGLLLFVGFMAAR